jgi:hydroxyacylglutathione hydrolase
MSILLESKQVKSLVVKQFVDEDLGNSSYLIASEESGLAAVIDPQRDVDKYIQTAEGLGLKIVYGLETHLHADFVSGVHELAYHFSLQDHHPRFHIGASAKANAEFHHLALYEGDRLSLGNLFIGVIDTPGHAPEHISFSIFSENSIAPEVLFSGGSLIVGGTGRPDLLGYEETIPLAHDLYHTLHHKLSHLPDDVIIYPTHGAGSFCNTTASGDRYTTLGEERRYNPFFRLQKEDEFVDQALNGLSSYPKYYQHLRAVNQKGGRVLGRVPILRPLTPKTVQQQCYAGAVLLDIRATRYFLENHIEGSYGIPLVTPLITWAGWVIPFGTPIILVGDTLSEREEAARHLIRIGYDDLRGFLVGGMRAWRNSGLPSVSTRSINAYQLNEWLSKNDAPAVLDVRYDKEWFAGHIRGAMHVEVSTLSDVASGLLPQDCPLVVHCQGGNRSTVAISILEQKGYTNLYALESGFNAWRQAGYEVVANGNQK